MIEEKYLVSGTLLDSVVQAMEETMYQAEVNSWELDVDFSTTVEEVRELLSGPAFDEFEQKSKEEDGKEEKGTEDEMESRPSEVTLESKTEEVPA